MLEGDTDFANNAPTLQILATGIPRLLQDTLLIDPQFSRSQNPAQLLSLFQTSQDTFLPESTPQTIGSFPRNFTNTSTPGSF